MTLPTIPKLARALMIAPEELVERTLEPVTIAVLDSGIDCTHPDLAGRVARAVSVELVDGKPAIVEGRTDRNNDSYGHGTAVASIACAVSPNAKIVDVKVLGEGRLGTGAALIVGLRFAVETRAAIVNMSLAAGAEFAGRLHALCELAYRQGQVVVAATRNMPLADHGFPAELSSVVSVDQRRMDSLFRIHYRRTHPIEYAAHGEEVPVAAAGGGHTTKTGTSFATPAVSGLCALWLGAFPGLRPFEIKALLKAFATEPESDVSPKEPSAPR
ncbi:MAG: S8 family serine peptidase [Myxococcales bacterium]|nr:S8 family serine peptidase [Myxococcales bacterium]